MKIVRAVALAALLAGLASASMAALQAGAEPTAPVEPPAAALTGRVLLKDGVTPVAGAELLLSGPDEGEQHVARTNRRGRFKLRLPVGEYLLRIARGTDLYRAPSSYRVSPGVRNEIDFLLLPDFESEKDVGPEPFSPRRRPDPHSTAPVEVGTVVDVVHAANGGWARRWAGFLGFVGSLIAVALAAD
jgi:hypothetical protein